MAISRRWAQLVADLRKKGQTLPLLDSMIAATALAHGLTVATHNVRDFQIAGVPVVDPFVRPSSNCLGIVGSISRLFLAWKTDTRITRCCTRSGVTRPQSDRARSCLRKPSEEREREAAEPAVRKLVGRVDHALSTSRSVREGVATLEVRLLKAVNRTGAGKAM
jgi:hypothetical protein